MSISRTVVVGVLFFWVFLLGNWWGKGGNAADPKADQSPAVVIDAAKHPNLQAALDAVPEAGGVVKLPPATSS